MGKLTIEQLSFLDRGPYSFTVDKSTVMGLSGGSGAGKTVLLRAIADLDVHEGRLMLDEMPGCIMSGPEWRRRVSYIAAESQWWFETVGPHFQQVVDYASLVERGFAAGVWFAPGRPHLPAAVDSASLAGLEKLGFDADVMNWEISRLSTGEKQRLALLRTLANQPGFLLLDEPTASLDKANVTAAEQLIRDYINISGAGCIWVSHDAEQLERVADSRLEILPGGKLRQLS